MTSIFSSENILGGNVPTSTITNIIPFKTENYGGDQSLAYKSGGYSRIKKSCRRKKRLANKKQSFRRRSGRRRRRRNNLF